MTNHDAGADVKEGLRRYLVEATGCEAQVGADGRAWPCGTCLIDLLNRLGLDRTKPAYDEQNPAHDRHNEVWRAILQIRDAT